MFVLQDRLHGVLILLLLELISDVRHFHINVSKYVDVLILLMLELTL